MADLKDEFFDDGLLGIGVDFTDETAPKKMPTMEHQPHGSEQKPANKCTAQKDDALDAQYVPVPNYKPTFYDRLKGCAKWAVTFGALCMLIFYWQQTGLMAPEAAVPSMCACNLLVGWGVGKNVVK